jgi:hypothetical protein
MSNEQFLLKLQEKENYHQEVLKDLLLILEAVLNKPTTINKVFTLNEVFSVKDAIDVIKENLKK